MKAKFDFDSLAVRGLGSAILGGILLVASFIMGKEKIVLAGSETVIDGALPAVLGAALLILGGIFFAVWFGSIFVEVWLEKRRAARQTGAADSK